MLENFRLTFASHKMAHYSNLPSRSSPGIGSVPSHVDEGNGKADPHDTRYNPKEKLTERFLLWGGLRWFLAATLSVLYYVVILLHQGHIVTSGQKSILDALLVGLSVAMGLNIATALKEIATHMRWWFLDTRQTDIHEVSSAHQRLLHCEG